MGKDSTKQIKIYLAGEMKADWKNNLIKYYNETFQADSIKNINWILPERVLQRKHSYDVSSECVNQDLGLIANCDIVFAYLNRGGLYSTIIEIMHSFFMNKRIIIVVEEYGEVINGHTDCMVATDVVGSTPSEFPFSTHYWFLLQYLKMTSKKIDNTCQPEHLDIFLGMTCENMEHILEYHIFDHMLPKKESREQLIKPLLDDLKNIKSTWKTTEITDRFKRNLSLVTDLKKKYNKCQLCDFTFKKKNGEYYNEIHHIIPLSQNGKDQEINSLIVCANCHRKLHYATVDISKILDNGTIIINGDVHIIKK